MGFVIKLPKMEGRAMVGSAAELWVETEQGMIKLNQIKDLSMHMSIDDIIVGNATFAVTRIEVLPAKENIDG